MAEIPFHFEIPLEISINKSGDPETERRIGGIVSTEHLDHDGEVLVQKGLDFTDFLKNGWFNDNHSKKTSDILGYPLRIEPCTHKGKPATFVEGYLLKNHPPADEIWNLAQSLQKTNRRLGFSVEGKVIQRLSDGLARKVAKAKVREVAITKCPVNDNTELQVLAKSLSVMEIADEEMFKALLAGQAITNPGVSPGEGFALRTESLDPKLKYTTYGPAKSVDKKKKKKKKKRLTKAEAIYVIAARYPKLNFADAEKIWQYAKRRSDENGK